MSNNININQQNYSNNLLNNPRGQRPNNAEILKTAKIGFTYLSISLLILYHFWINFIFLFNSLNSNGYLEYFYYSVNEVPETLFPGFLYFKIVNKNEQCDESNGYSEANLRTWPGTIEGYYNSPLKYNGKCSFISCDKNSTHVGYRKDYCYVTKDVYKRTCCNYILDTAFPYDCYSTDDGNSCYCPERYFTKREIFYNFTVKNLTTFPELTAPIKFFNNSKICQKFIPKEKYTLFEENCDGVKCFNDYFCIKNETTCPNQKNIFSKSFIQEPIINITLNYNSILLSKIKNFNKRDVGKIVETDNFFSNFRRNIDSPFGANSSNLYVDDIKYLGSLTSKQVYLENGILDKIIEHDKLIKKEELKLEPFIKDELYLSASTYFKFYSLKFCKRSDLLDIINDSVYNARNVILYKFSIWWCLLLFFLLIPLAYPIKLIYKGTFSIENKKEIRLILLINVIYLIFNWVIFYMYESFDKDDLIGKLNSVKNCFDSQDFRSYLENISYGLDNYNDLFDHTLKYIIIENSAFLILFTIVISPICSICEIFKFK
jgi:hypothetical protein